jgi:succinate dehydrogenase / fumarate reductase cytochrome b subunit
MTHDKRPLSPHLQIYRPQLTSVLSIFHRFTGVVLSIGFIWLVVWLVALAVGGEYISNIHFFWKSFFGKFLLLGFLFSFSYHFFNGIRHLFWDVGLGLDIKTVYSSGWATLIFSTMFTFFIWCIVGGF